MDWYFHAFKNQFNFRGRATRSEFWYFFLFDNLICIVAICADTIISKYYGRQFTFFAPIAAVIHIMPLLSVYARRMHDHDRSAWWLLSGILILPYLWIFFLLVTEGTHGDNKYGADIVERSVYRYHEHYDKGLNRESRRISPTFDDNNEKLSATNSHHIKSSLDEKHDAVVILIDRIEKLASMRQQKLISDTEYGEIKSALIARI